MEISAAKVYIYIVPVFMGQGISGERRQKEDKGQNIRKSAVKSFLEISV